MNQVLYMCVYTHTCMCVYTHVCVYKYTCVPICVYSFSDSFPLLPNIEYSSLCCALGPCLYFMSTYIVYLHMLFLYGNVYALIPVS